MRATVVLLMLTIGGCDDMASYVSKLRKERLTELADTQARVDLAIAKADIEAIEGNQARYDSIMKAVAAANTAKNYAKGESLGKELEAAGDDLDKAIDKAARHRCAR